MDFIKRLREDARRRLVSAAEDRALRAVTKETDIPLSQVRLYNSVVGWGSTVSSGATKIFDVPHDMDGEDAAYLVAAGLNSGFKVAYIAHSRKLHVTKDPSSFSVTPRIVGITKVVTG